MGVEIRQVYRECATIECTTATHDIYDRVITVEAAWRTGGEHIVAYATNYRYVGIKIESLIDWGLWRFVSAMNNPDAETLRELIRSFIRRFGLLDQSHTPCGLPMTVSDAHALVELLRSPDLEALELSKRLGLSKSAVSRLLLRLKRRGQITQKRDRNDGRACNLRLTEKGKRQAEMINRESRKIFGVIISGLPEEAVRRLLQYLPLLIKSLPESRQDLNAEFVQTRLNEFQKE